MAETHTRQAARTPVTLKIKFKSSTLDQFIERYSVDVSHGGIFIRTKDPLPVGTQLRFEFQLKDASPLIRGEGTVVWTREHDPNRTGVAPGMGVRFDRLAEGSQDVLDKILSQKTAKGGPKGPSFNEQPTRVTSQAMLAGLSEKATAPKMGNLAPQRDGFGGPEITSSDATPLPKPMPFHSDVDDFPEEAFEEATKVASLDALAAQSVRDRDDDEDILTAAAAARAAAVRDELAERRAAKTRPADELPAAAELPAPVAAAVDDSAARAAEADRRAEDDRRAEAARTAAARAKAEQEAKQEAAANRPMRRSGTSPAADQAVRASASAAAAVDTPVAQPKRGRGTTYVLVVLLLLAGGGAAWWYTRDRGADDQGTTTVAQRTPAGPAPSIKPPTQPKDNVIPAPPVDVKDPPQQPVETFAASVEATPATAIIELLSDGQRGKGAIAFKDLDKAKPHTVRISAPGFVAQEVVLDPAKSKTVKIKLAAKPYVLRITSVPAGAKVTVRDKVMPGVTPLEVTVDDKLRRKDLSIKLTMTGFEPVTVAASGTEGFTEGDATMEREVSATLTAAQVAVVRVNKPPRPPVDKPPVDKPPVDKPPVDKPPVDKPPVDKPPVDKPPVDTTGKPPVDKPPADKPPADKPPADKPPADKPPADKPPADKPPADKPDDGPKPDWMK